MYKMIKKFDDENRNIKPYSEAYSVGGYGG